MHLVLLLNLRQVLTKTLGGVLVRTRKHCLLYIFHITSLLYTEEQGIDKIGAEHDVLLKITALLGKGLHKTRLAWRGPEKSLRLRSPRGLYMLVPGFRGEGHLC